MHEKRSVRYRSVGLVDLGVGLGSPSPLVLKAADRLDLLLGDRIWPTRGRVGGLPYYGQAYPAGLPEHLGWGLSPDRLTRWIPALWPNPDGSPRELWAVREGRIERLHVSAKAPGALTRWGVHASRIRMPPKGWEPCG